MVPELSAQLERSMGMLENWLSKEFHRHPLFALFCVVAAGSSVGVVFNPFVMAADFATFQSSTNVRLEGLEGQVNCLQYSTDRNALNAELRYINTEMFQIERLVETGDATDRDLDRLDKLRTDKEGLQLDLSTLVNSAQCAK